MSKMLIKYTKTKALIKELKEFKVSPKKDILTSIFAGILMIIIAIPFYFLMLELFKQYSSVTWVFKLLIVIFFILIFMICPLYSTIYLMIIKYYTEKEELANLNGFYMFLVEFTRISSIITSTIIASIMTFLVCKFMV